MAIKSYVPKKSTVIDRRTTDGGYYVADCEICGREFYPKRSNAKFCSNVCGQRAHRNATLKKGGTTAKKVEETENITVRGIKNTIAELKKHCKFSKGDVGETKNDLYFCEIGEHIEWNSDVHILRVSDQKFEIIIR